MNHTSSTNPDLARIMAGLTLASVLVSAASSSSSSPPSCRTADCGDPLNVSPLIAAGQLAEARQQLLVSNLGEMVQ